MKNIILILVALTLTVTGSFAQGYFLFTASKGAIWDNPGGNWQYSAGDVYTTFLWANSLSFNGGIPTNSSTMGSWSTVRSLLQSGASIAVNANTSTEVSVLSNTSNLSKGGINYLSSSSFPVANTIGGNSYQIIPVAWLANGGSTLSTAMASSSTFLGYGNSFTYASGASSLATVSSFTTAGMIPFGVVITPEPTPIALAVLGAATMLSVRKKQVNK